MSGGPFVFTTLVGVRGWLHELGHQLGARQFLDSGDERAVVGRCAMRDGLWAEETQRLEQIALRFSHEESRQQLVLHRFDDEESERTHRRDESVALAEGVVEGEAGNARRGIILLTAEWASALAAMIAHHHALAIQFGDPHCRRETIHMVTPDIGTDRLSR